MAVGSAEVRSAVHMAAVASLAVAAASLVVPATKEATVATAAVPAVAIGVV